MASLQIILDSRKNNPFYNALEAGEQEFKNLWHSCKRGDWMLMVAAFLQVDSRRLAVARGECAHTVFHLMWDYRSREGVRAVIDFGNGLITEEQLETFIQPAIEAAYGIGSSASGYDRVSSFAARTAAYATNIHYLNIGAAAFAAADTAAENNLHYPQQAREVNQMQTAIICRRLLTQAVFLKVTEISSDPNITERIDNWLFCTIKT